MKIIFQENYNMKTTLYELTSAWKQVYDMDEIDPETWFDTLDGIDEAIEEKADNIAKLIKELDGNTEALKTEIARLTDKKRVNENKIARLKKYLQQAMEFTGKTKFKTNLFSFNIQKNPASVQIDNEKAIPSTYWVEQPPKLDKKTLLAELKGGDHIAGVSLKQSESLRIR